MPLLKFAGDDAADWSVSYNHHYAREDDWENVLYGSHYPRLLEIKKKYDPDHRFNVWHGPGYENDLSACGERDDYLWGIIPPFMKAFIRQVLDNV